jgi:hypothetical protein
MVNTLVILLLRRLREKDCRFEVNLLSSYNFPKKPKPKQKAQNNNNKNSFTGHFPEPPGSASSLRVLLCFTCHRIRCISVAATMN